MSNLLDAEKDENGDYMENSFTDYYKDDQGNNFYSIAEILKETQNSSFKGAVVFNDLALSMKNFKKPADQKLYFNKLDEKVMSYNMAVRLPGYRDPLHSTFKLKINQLIQAGFFNYWMDVYLKDPSIVTQEEEDVRVVLTMGHLDVGFILWISFLAIGCAAFVLELGRFYSTFYFDAFLRTTVLRSFYQARSH